MIITVMNSNDLREQPYCVPTANAQMASHPLR